MFSWRFINYNDLNADTWSYYKHRVSIVFDDAAFSVGGGLGFCSGFGLALFLRGNVDTYLFYMNSRRYTKKGQAKGKIHGKGLSEVENKQEDRQTRGKKKTKEEEEIELSTLFYTDT